MPRVRLKEKTKTLHLGGKQCCVGIRCRTADDSGLANVAKRYKIFRRLKRQTKNFAKRCKTHTGPDKTLQNPNFGVYAPASSTLPNLAADTSPIQISCSNTMESLWERELWRRSASFSSRIWRCFFFSSNGERNRHEVVVFLCCRRGDRKSMRSSRLTRSPAKYVASTPIRDVGYGSMALRFRAVQFEAPASVTLQPKKRSKDPIQAF